MILISSKLANRIALLTAEVAALRSALETEIEKARSAERALAEARSAIDTLSCAQQDLQDRLNASIAQTNIGPLERRIEELERQDIQRNRVLRLEQQVAQQAEDLRTAVAGLIMRVDDSKRTGKTS